MVGHGETSGLPQEVKHAILLKPADLYNHRGVEDKLDRDINVAVESLLWSDRVGLF